ncbi:tRNA lysidine(34) synthetase TilS [Synechocystis sp. PCC 7509]|uniref:tRNA lysidine(34) synthetase TilS n=1 Tax=Synechocystis sp. PCC 7509 TaxID=927677 RepID=UPI0002AC6FED|nr:tRNA lysidine(34) synthetase TilS [Synechocystis sp. PCC 7509]
MSDLPLWTPLHAQLHRTLKLRQLLPKNQRLLIAVSGGQDSLCLIKLLLDLQPKWRWKLAIAHCNHRTRTDCEANALHVETLASAWSIPYYGAITDRSLQSEAAARLWRYEALREIATANDYHYIVTGHTSSDRAETLLYNLIRGSGADGLQALTWQRSLDSGLQLIRPLLQVQRAATAQFCQAMQLPVWEDSTNQDLKYARNRIRHELLPYLYNFNPQVETALAQTAELLHSEVEYLEFTAQQLHAQAACHPTEPLKLNCQVLQASPLALQRRVLRQWLFQLLNRSPNFEQIEKLIALVYAPNHTQTDPFFGGAIARVENGWIFLTPP